VGGQKTNSNNDFKIISKVKKKKNFKKNDFLILLLNFALIKYLTPHPNPLPTSGERGLEGISLLI
jgi:hypothetical protein